MATKPIARAASGGDGGQAGGGLDELRARAAALAPDDIEGAKAIIEAAVVLPHMDELEKDRLLGALKKALGVASR